MRRLDQRQSLLRAAVIGLTFLAIAVAAAMAEPSSLSGPALAVGLVLGAALMQTFIGRGLAVPGYSAARHDIRRAGWGVTIGVGFAIFATSAASALVPGALAVMPVAVAALLAGFFLVLIPNLLRSSTARG